MVRALLVIAVAPLLHAQVIQVETREVPVDVTVTGKKAGELTAKDFSVWEDGKPQKINSVTSAAASAERTIKHFVLYFDFTAMPVPDQAASQKAALEFIGGMASPDRYMAVTAMTGSGARVLQDFTAAPTALQNAVKAIPSMSGNRSNGAGLIPLADSLVAVAHSLGPAPGRKALILFTSAYAYPNADVIKAIVVACNRADVALYVIASENSGNAARMDIQKRNVSLYPTTPGTVHLGSDADSQPAATFAHLLADGTGGEALSLTASLKDRLAAAAREQDEYYRVFYTPPTSKEGACHTLRVALNERGLVSKSRNEYCTEKQPDIVAGRIAGQELESRAAGATADTLPSTMNATMQLPYFYTGTNRAVVHLSASIRASGKAPLDIVGTATRADGGIVARFADTVSVDRLPYRYEQQFTLPAGAYTFQLAMGGGPGLFGKISAPLKVDPWNSAKFGIADIAFSTEARPVDSIAAVAPILEGQGPLTAGGKEFTPASTSHFQRSDQLYFYTEIYDAEADPATLRLQFRIIDAKTSEVKVDTGLNSIAGYVHNGNPVIPFATRLPVAQLPAGVYRLEVRAMTSNQDAVVRTADFELN